MKGIKHIETRWRVRRNVYPGDLQSALNKLELKGWTIAGVHVIYNNRFTVVAQRRVRVYR